MAFAYTSTLVNNHPPLMGEGQIFFVQKKNQGEGKTFVVHARQAVRGYDQPTAE
ncbi:Uncharacterised protein [Actinobacillus equuli]|nr:Uncharacterised protein [Actinobacillus equuli]